MITVLNAKDVATIVNALGLKTFFNKLITTIEHDFSQWPHFQLSPRHATHFPNGVIELMPAANNELYSFKYVNGHPNNPQQNKLTVIAIGMLTDASNGYPLLLADMTLATALRTAATSALAAKYLAKKTVHTLGIIGTGSQSEFQILAQHFLTGASTIRYFDTDPQAMKKFHGNLQDSTLELIPCPDIQSTVTTADIVTTATAAKITNDLIDEEWIQPGTLINAIGGDCPGKTELNPALLQKHTTVVEFLEQSTIEGEIQNLEDYSKVVELWEIITQQHPGRRSQDEIIYFDSVGCAIEDFSILSLLYQLSEELNLGEKRSIVPNLTDPKNLFSSLKSQQTV